MRPTPSCFAVLGALLGVFGTVCAKIACVGDSITAKPHASSELHDYPRLLANMTGQEVVNLGVGGKVVHKNTARSWWSTPAYTELTSHTWDKVVVMLGTSDWYVPEWTYENRMKCDADTAEKLKECSFASDYNNLIADIKASQIFVVVPPPIMGRYGKEMMHFVNTLLPRILPIIAEANGAKLIDVYSRMGGTPKWTEMFPEDGCSEDSDYAPCKWFCDTQNCDQCYPNDQGCKRLATIVHEGITASV